MCSGCPARVLRVCNECARVGEPLAAGRARGWSVPEEGAKPLEQDADEDACGRGWAGRRRVRRRRSAHAAAEGDDEADDDGSDDDADADAEEAKEPTSDPYHARCPVAILAWLDQDLDWRA